MSSTVSGEGLKTLIVALLHKDKGTAAGSVLKKHETINISALPIFIRRQQKSSQQLRVKSTTLTHLTTTVLRVVQ